MAAMRSERGNEASSCSLCRAGKAAFLPMADEGIAEARRYLAMTDTEARLARADEADATDGLVLGRGRRITVTAQQEHVVARRCADLASLFV